MPSVYERMPQWLHARTKKGPKWIDEMDAKPASTASRESRSHAGSSLSPQLYALFCVLSVLPFLLINYPPIVDYPNHLARMSLACGISDPIVSAMYTYRITVIPNLALDLINLPLCGLVSPGGVIKVTITTALAVIYSAGWLVQRKLFGGTNVFLLMLPAVSFNLVTLMGYINFLVGIAVVCALLTAVVVRRPKIMTTLLFGNISGILIFFAHIFALIIALVFFFGWHLRNKPVRPRTILIAGMMTLAMFAIPLALVPLVASSGEPLSLDYAGKYRMVVVPFMSQQYTAEFVVLAAGLIFPLYFGLRSGRVALHPYFRMPLGFLLTYVLLVPGQIQDAVDIDARSLVALAYLAFFVLEPSLESRRVKVWVTSLSSLLIVIHLTVAVTTWRQFSEQIEEFRASLNELPQHASVLSVSDDDGGRQVVSPLSYSHLASYATLDRRVFNPLEFTGLGMQPLAARQAFAALDTPSALPFSPQVALRLKYPDAARAERARHVNAEFALRWQKRFDYVLYYHFGKGQNFDPTTLTAVQEGSFFSIFEVKRDGHR